MQICLSNSYIFHPPLTSHSVSLRFSDTSTKLQTFTNRLNTQVAHKRSNLSWPGTVMHSDERERLRACHQVHTVPSNLPLSWFCSQLTKLCNSTKIMKLNSQNWWQSGERIEAGGALKPQIDKVRCERIERFNWRKSAFFKKADIFSRASTQLSEHVR